MPTYAVNRLISHSPEQLFDLVADVERYPEFLPWWRAARIERWDGDAYYTDQVIGFRGFVGERFRSKTVLDRPTRIDVASHGGPFRRFDIRWTFEPAPSAGCRVGILVDVEPRPKLVQGLLTLLFVNAMRRVVGAFERRARQIYGPAPERPPPTSG